MRTLTQFLAGQQPGPDGVDLQALLERVPPRRHRARPSTSSAPTRWCPTGRPPRQLVPGRRPGRAQLVDLVGRHVPQRPGRHDLRRHEPDPAQHHRRDGARAPEGAEAPTPARGPTCRTRARLTPGTRLWRSCSAVARAARAVADRGRPGGRAWPAGVGGDGRRSFRCPTRRYSASGCRPQYGDPRHAAEPADIVTYLRMVPRVGRIRAMNRRQPAKAEVGSRGPGHWCSTPTYEPLCVVPAAAGGRAGARREGRSSSTPTGALMHSERLRSPCRR